MIKEIEYRYLNMDRERFEESAEALAEYFRGIGGLTRAIPNWQHDQVLYASGSKSFSKTEAIRLCKQLSGVTNGRS